MNKLRVTFINFVMILFISTFSYAGPTDFVNGKVAYISDGDTITVETANSEKVTIRLYGIDCPEKEWRGHWPEQKFSKEAKEAAQKMVSGKEVSVRLKGEKTYDRAVGEVFIDGKSLNRELVRLGLAWWDKKYEPYDYDLKRLQEKAKKLKIGIWSEENPTPPWEHRRKR